MSETSRDVRFYDELFVRRRASERVSEAPAARKFIGYRYDTLGKVCGNIKRVLKREARQCVEES